MKQVSIGAAWTEANLFIRREAGLLFPVILLFVAIPMALIFQAIPEELRNMKPGGEVPTPQLPGSSLVLMIVCAVVMIGGTLSCYTLALKPGISLREALIHGFRRIPVSLAAGLLIAFVLAVPMTLLGFIAPGAGEVFVLVAALFISARLVPLNAIIVDRHKGAFTALRLSWDLTKGNTGRLLLFIIAVTIPIILARIVAELLLGLVGLSLGGPELGRQAGDLGAATAMAVGQVYMIVMSSRLYRQLED